MTRVPRPSRTGVAFAVLCSLVAGACGDARKSPLSPLDAVPNAAKVAGVSVKATDPAYGDQGQVNEIVTITGSGFKAGARAAWLLNGVADTTITVSSTQFVNSTTVVAIISIGKKSPLNFRDVQVMNSDRTQGIGAAVFEVTQAQIIPGAGPARGVNDNGEVTGSLPNGGTFYYNIASGLLQTVSTTSPAGFAISPFGNAIVGGGGSNGSPYLFTRAGPIGTAWTATPLPVDPKAIGGTADAMVTDPITGQVTLVGGIESLPSIGGCAASNAVVWAWQGSTGTWQRIVLPNNGICNSEIRPRGLSDNGTVVGRVGSTAAVWTPNGSGGYTLTLLDADYANGIDGGASMIVGEKSAPHGRASFAVYWRSSAGGWGNAQSFTGGCVASRDVADASGRATLLDCPFGSNSQTYAGFIDPPYTTPMKLGGVGGHNNNFVGAISPSGRYMVGNGYTSGGVQVGVYWVP